MSKREKRQQKRIKKFIQPRKTQEVHSTQQTQTVNSMRKATTLKDIPKDVAYLIVKDLSLTDISNFYKAGGEAKTFVEKNFLKKNHLLIYKVKEENLTKYNRILEISGISTHVKFETNRMFFYHQVREGKHIEICLKKSFFEKYYCFRPISLYSIVTAHFISTGVSKIGISIDDPTVISSKTEKLGWNCLSTQKIIDNFKINMLNIPNEGLINLTFDKQTMEFIFNLMEGSYEQFSVSDNVLTIGYYNKKISQKLSEKVSDFFLQLKIDKVHLLHYTFPNIIFSLSNNFLLLHMTEKDYEFKIFFTQTK